MDCNGTLTGNLGKGGLLDPLPNVSCYITLYKGGKLSKDLNTTFVMTCRAYQDCSYDSLYRSLQHQ